MELADIGTGTRLELEPEGYTDSDTRPVYVSSFEWVESDGTAAITAPIFEGRIMPLEKGSVYNVYFLKRQGKLLSLYSFRAAIRERLVIDNLHLLLIEQLDSIEKIQRRSFFRLDCYLDVKYRVLRSLKDRNNSEIPFRKTITSDMSGGGIRILLDERLEPGTYVECELFGENNQKIRFFGKIVRFERTGDAGRYRYATGVAYVDIDEKEREAVIKYIFREQRKLLRKGVE
ncbi:MAG: PilZ domain-containing protein [Acetivibrionales bacterium]|jgi:c-di-GMP-binding flagellar brake protein YcgR|nr:PilZ domain-containing protein [Bacillota bacterium]